MGIFGDGRDHEGYKSIDSKVKFFLESCGFKIFSSDGEYFLDEKGNQYGPWMDLCSTEKVEEVENGKKHHEVIRGARGINFNEDAYRLLFETSYCWMGRLHVRDGMRFLDEACPSPSYYNAAIVSPVATWREDGMDGGSQKTLYSLLMLQSREKRRKNVIRNPTPEEIRLREIELSTPPF